MDLEQVGAHALRGQAGGDRHEIAGLGISFPDLNALWDELGDFRPTVSSRRKAADCSI